MLYTYKKLKSIDYLIFAIIIGVISTFWNYNYGYNNTVETIPKIMRALDDSYLVNDFVVNQSTQGFHARYFFTKFIVLLNNVFSIPFIYFFLTLISNVFVSLITYKLAIKLFNNSKSASVLSVALVMSVSTVTLGSRLYMFSNFLTPYDLSLPLVLTSIYYGINNKNPLLIGFLCGIAGLIHAQLGLGAGTIILFTMLISNIIQKQNKIFDYIKIIIGFIITLVLSCVSIIPFLNTLSEGGNMTIKDFVYITVYLRNPHHYLPSYILTRRLITIPEAISFFGASGIAWYWWKRSSKTLKKQANFIVIFTSIIFLTCIGGYIFVEIFPSRLWILAQPFRYVNFLKWLGIIMIAGAISSFISNTKDKPFGYLLWINMLTPITAFIGLISKPIRSFSRKHLPSTSTYFELGPILILSVSILSLLIYYNKIIISPLLFLLSSFISLTLLKKQKILFYLISLSILLFIALNAFILPHINLPSKIESKLEMFFRPKFSFANSFGDDVEIGRFVSNNTPEEAIFLTPPEFGILRIVGKRAIVVDYVNGLCTQEWHERLLDCYGSTEAFGFSALNKMDENFKNITDEKILSIKEKYNISYAILYKETKTHYPILYKNNTYKLIYLCK